MRQFIRAEGHVQRLPPTITQVAEETAIRKRALIAFIAANPQSKAENMAKGAKLNRSTVNQYLSEMRADGLVIRVKKGNGYLYEVVS